MRGWGNALRTVEANRAVLTPADLTHSFGDSFAPGKQRQTKHTDTCTWAILPRQQLIEAALIVTPSGSKRAAQRVSVAWC